VNQIRMRDSEQSDELKKKKNRPEGRLIFFEFIRLL